MVVNEDSIPPGLICPYCNKKAMSVFCKLFIVSKGPHECKNCKNIVGVNQIKLLWVTLPVGILLFVFYLKWIKFGGGIKDVILLFGLSLPFVVIHTFLSIKSSNYLPLIPKEDTIKNIYLKIFR